MEKNVSNEAAEKKKGKGNTHVKHCKSFDLKKAFNYKMKAVESSATTYIRSIVILRITFEIQ